MFKIESYITPIILSYVDKYIKNLKPEDSQVSLWGGDAVFNNLDLRLDVLEHELGTPFTFVNGHIHELRIHVPWTKLGSEPVVITINTIECILKLREDVSSDRDSPTGSASGILTSIKVRGEPKVAGKPLDSSSMLSLPPPNYVQSLINRVINNISIVCNNVILKYVEDDIVLSLNAKSVEVFSTNNKWDRAFSELSLPELVLRKVIRLIDLTVCLDRRDASGRISLYQDPLLYRCSLDCRLHLAFESLYGNRLLATRFDILCDQLDFSVTDHQLTMFLRLIELGLALQANELTSVSTQILNKDQAATPDNSEPTSDGWSSWLWSYVPTGISIWSEGDSIDEKQNFSSSIFHFGIYVKRASYMFKVEEIGHDEASNFSNRKINFRPLCGLIIEDQYVDVVARGIDVFNLKVGAAKVTGVLCGNCSCGVVDTENSDIQFFIAGIEKDSSSNNDLFLRGSLFDDESCENGGQHREYCFDWDQHFYSFSDEYIQNTKYALNVDYFYFLEIPDDISEKSSGISVTDLENSNLKERTNVRIFITSPQLNINSSVVHRYQTIMAATTPYEYEPYAKQKDEPVNENIIMPTDETVLALERFIPFKFTKIVLLKPLVIISMANHPKSLDDVKPVTRRKGLKIPDEVLAIGVNQLPKITILGRVLEFQQRIALYPKRLVSIVSLLKSPSEYLMTNCHYNFATELREGCATVSYGILEKEIKLPFIEPCQIIWRKKSLLYPVMWKNPVLPSSEFSIEVGQFSVISTVPQIIFLKVMWATWFELQWHLPQLLSSSLIQDTFAQKTGNSHISLRLRVCNILWRQCQNETLKSLFVTLGSAFFDLENIDNKRNRNWAPIFYGPQISSASHTLNFFQDANLFVDLSQEPLDKPLFQLTLQVPINVNNIITPVAFLLYVQNSVICFDTRLCNWILYRPFVSEFKDTMASLSNSKTLTDTYEVECHSKEEDSKDSWVSIGGGVTTTDASKTKSLTADSSNRKRKTNSYLSNSIGFISEWYLVLQKMTIQVEFKGIHIFLCKTEIPWSFDCDLHGNNILYAIRHMVLAKTFPNSIVANVPAIIISNDGQKLPFPIDVMNIPISSLSGCNKFPWTVRIENYSVISLCQYDYNYLLFPEVISSTVAINSKTGHLNLTQLNVCIHCDFQTVHVHLSQFQTKLAVEIIMEHVFEISSFFSMVTTSGWKVLFISSNAWPIFSEICKDGKDMKKMSRESSFSEKEKSSYDVLSLTGQERTESGIKVSLWLQSTLPKLNVDFVERCSTLKSTRVSFQMEDITCSFDIQEVYSKIKLKVASLRAKHFIFDDNEWKLGDYGGVIFSSGQSGSGLFLTSIIPVRSEQPHENALKIGDTSGSFLIVTYTRVQRKNVQKRWAKILRERSGGDDSLMNQAIRNSSDINRPKFISEIDIKLLPMEIVLQVPLLRCIVKVYLPVLNLISSSMPKTIKTNEIMPTWSTATLPLIYFSCGEINLFCPNPSINEEREAIGCKIIDDLTVLQLSSIDLSPNADNPLSRLIVKSDLYNVAQRAGILKIPGSEVEDRQYQIDIKGLALSTGLWEQLIKSSNVTTLEANQSKTMGENPAVEWNLKTNPISNVFPRTTLSPLISSFDLRIVAAPAIVYEKEELDFHLNDILIAGHSLEVNVSSNVLIYCGFHQLDLLIKTASLFNQDCEKDIEYKESFNVEKKYIGKNIRDMDSGIESEATSSPGLAFRNLQSPLDINQLSYFNPSFPINLSTMQLPLNTVPQNSDSIEMSTPFEVLLTAGLITISSYFPEHYLNVPNELKYPKFEQNRNQGPHNTESDNISKLRKRYKNSEPQDLSTSSDDESLKIRPIRYRRKIKENAISHADLTVGYDGSVESSEDESCVNENLSGIIPVFYILVSQPYSLIKRSKDSYKLELSCFDLIMRGVNSLKPIQCDIRLPKLQNYCVQWFETVHGDPDAKTGIPPSLYTLTVVGQPSKKPNVTFKIERPVKFIWDNWKYEQILFLANSMNYFNEKNISSGQSVSWKKWINSIYELHFVTKQIIVLLENVEAIDTRLVFSTANCSTIIKSENQILKNDDILANFTLLFSMNGCMVKSQLMEPEPRPMLGPISVTFESSIKWEEWSSFPFFCIKLGFDTIICNLDHTHLKCIKSILNNLIKSDTKNKSGKSSSFSFFPKFDDTTNSSQIWQDDLRVGVFQYTQNSDELSNLPILPGPNEIVFRKEQGGYGASMTWKYPEPRALIRAEIHPVPFRVAVEDMPLLDENAQKLQTEVSCALQYWDEMLSSFITYRVFSLSEIEPCILDLPMANLDSRRDLIVSSSWRVLMDYSDVEEDLYSDKRQRCSVSPLALAACMRVDSCFRPSFIPAIKFRLSLDILKIAFRNNFSFIEDIDNFYGVIPYKLDGTLPPYHEFLIVTLENLKFFHRHWNDECKAELEVTTQLEILDYHFLSLQNLMDPNFVKVHLSVAHDDNRQKPYELETLIDFGSIYFHLEPKLLYSLTLACKLWAENEEVPKQLYLPCAYVICNSTLETIRFGQVDTDENIVLSSLKAHAYSWRTSKCKMIMHLCIEGMLWKWCEPFNIDEDGIQVIEVENENRRATILVKVQQLNIVQKKVTISGQLLIDNRLDMSMDILLKRSTTTSSLTDDINTTLLPSPNYIISFIIQHEDSWQLQVKATAPTKSKSAVWSSSIFLDNCIKLSPLQVINTNGQEINFWCNIFKEKIGNATQQLVILCPMYIVKSHLPQDIFMEIVTPSLGTATSIILSGKAIEQQVFCPGQPQLQHNINFRLNLESAISSPSISLIPRVKSQTSKRKIDINALCDRYLISQETDWPPYAFEDQKIASDSSDSLIEQSLVTNLQEMNLEVSMKPQWPECDTILINIKPWGLITNQSNIDCGIVYCRHSLKDSILIPAKCTVALPKILEAAKLYIYYNNESYSSNSFYLNHDADGWLSQTSSTNAYQHLNITINSPKMKTCFFSFCRRKHTKDPDFNIFTISSRYNVINLSRSELNLFSFVRSSNKQPLMFEKTDWLTIEPSSSPVEILFWETVLSANEINCDYVPHMTISHPLESSKWSIPLVLRFEEESIGSQKENVFAVVVPSSNLNNLSTAYRISCQNILGCVILSIVNDDTPQFLLHNRCPVDLFVAQGSIFTSDDGADTVVPDDILNTPANELSVVESQSSLYYTLPYVTLKYPQIYDPSTLPRLHLAEGTLNNSLGIEWSNGIYLNSDADQFITVPNCGDVKIHMRTTSVTTHIFFDPVNRIEVTAKEIRSRIKRRTGETIVGSSGRKFNRSTKSVTPIPKWRIEEGEEISFVTSPTPSTPTVNNRELIDWSFYGVGHLSHICLIVYGLDREIIRINFDHFIVATRSVSDSSTQAKDFYLPAERANRNWQSILQELIICVGDLQIDNQLIASGGYDFPVVLLRQTEISTDVSWTEISSARRHSLMTVTAAIQGYNAYSSKWLIKDIEIKFQPIAFYVEDALLYAIIDVMKHVQWPHPTSNRYVTPLVKPPSTLVLRRLVVHPISLLLSLRVSSKFFIAFDHTPLTFKSFERTRICTTWHRLGHTLAVHYMSGALVCAGWVIGSMDLLANPGGFARAVGTGFSDLFRLPYRGFLNGPWSFISGIIQGTSSLLNHIGSGTVVSITNLASSISRNMDYFSMDNVHLERNEELRRYPPQGLTAGLSQGLTGLGISLLGAMAGIVHQPLQSIHDRTTERPLTRTAAGILSGVGKGLVGVVVKPIGGAAEFVAQAGQGILNGAGWIRVHKPRYEPSVKNPANNSNSWLKYVWKMLPNSKSSSDLIIAVEATHINPNGNYLAITLLLTSEVLFILSQDSDNQQQAFSLTELNCHGDDHDPTLVMFFTREIIDDGFKSENNQSTRVAEFVDRTSKYTIKGNPDETQKITIDELENYSSSSSSPSYRTDPWNSKTPTLNYYLHPRFRDTFLICYTIAQRKLMGQGFN